MINDNYTVLKSETVQSSVKYFVSKNNLDKQLGKEIGFICDSFCTYYSSVQEDRVLSVSTYQLIDNFEKSMQILSSSQGATLNPLSILLYKSVPAIEKVIRGINVGSQSERERVREKEMLLNLKEKELNNKKKELEEKLEASKKVIKKAEKYTNSYYSSSGCGGSSVSSSRC